MAASADASSKDFCNSYEYMNENEIDDELKCIICTRPFEKPVSLSCQHTFCQKCIEIWLNERQSCPICREFNETFSIINTKIINKQLDRLLVQCKQCLEINIQRGNFNNHEEKCLKKYISCLSSDIQCKWKGPRDELNIHLITCPFQQIRPIIDSLQNQLNTLLKIQNEFQNKFEYQTEKINFLLKFINQGNIMNKECTKLYSRCQYSIRNQNKLKIIYYCTLCENIIQRRYVSLHSCSLNNQINCICQYCYEKQYPILDDTDENEDN